MQELIVGLIVFFACCAIARRYAPKALRQFARRSIVRAARKIGWKALAGKFEKQAEDDASCGSGCGKCGACDNGSAAKAGEKPVTMPTSLKRTNRFY